MNLQDLSTQLLFTTVPILVERTDSAQSLATGFIFSLPVPGSADQQTPFLVTNAHVVANAKRAIVVFSERENEGPKSGSRLRAEIDFAASAPFTDSTHDLAIVPIGGLLNQQQEMGRPVFFRSVAPELIPDDETISDLAALEQVTFIGYPSGLYDEHNATPLLRQGITATPAWNNFQGKPAFLIDAGVFPGSSGSPVFIMNQGAYPTRSGLTVGNRLLFMGVLTGTILRQEGENLPPVYLGLGKVIKAARLREFAEQTRQQLTARGAG